VINDSIQQTTQFPLSFPQTMVSTQAIELASVCIAISPIGSKNFMF